MGLLATERRLYSARPILISPTCKRESSSVHAELIEATIRACNRASENLPGRLFSIASDGEARRGAALNRLTLKRPVSKESPLYPLIGSLPLMNLLVGDDEVTADKDYKHIFKRFRALVLREKGIMIYGFKVTPEITKYHLLMSDHRAETVNAWMRPKDAQDVPTTLSLLCALWELPNLSDGTPGTNPMIQDARKALHRFGRLLFYLVMPYIDITLSLRKQLEYLSAAMHIALDLYAHHPTNGAFLPNLLYADLAIMVKNVYFSVAKAKILDPESSLHIILLGTDRLETSFGILRTMVGNDANVDMLQLSTRLGHVSECANILARYPHWDRSPRRLRLPTLEGLRKSSHEIDHVNVASWEGDVCVKNVVLLTCWHAGLELAAEGDPLFMERMQDRRRSGNVDILSPLGTLMLRTDGTFDYNDDTLRSALMSDSTPATTGSELSASATLDVEDAAGLSSTTNSTRRNDAFIQVDGKKIHKATALKTLFMHMSRESSTDRTRRVMGLDKYAVNTTYPNIYQSDDFDTSPENHLHIQDPAVTLVRCDGYVFLAVIMVSGIKKGNEVLSHIPIPTLREGDVVINCQVLNMVLHDPDVRDGDEVWTWSRKYESRGFVVPGGHVHPVNPILVTREALEPAYEFSKSELQGLSATLFSKIGTDDLRNLPQMKKTDVFPYRSRGKLVYTPTADTPVLICRR